MTKTNDPDEHLTEAAPSKSAPGAPDPSREKDPERIREGIEQTREELGETVDALAAKADIKARATEIAGQAAAAAERRPLPAIGGALIVGVFLGWALRRR
jgi:ElaB/YqjD/DUF883 family membrane-anchored ribosome-binding protein